jgi:hypothetical protein
VSVLFWGKAVVRLNIQCVCNVLEKTSGKAGAVLYDSMQTYKMLQMFEKSHGQVAKAGDVAWYVVWQRVKAGGS